MSAGKDRRADGAREVNMVVLSVLALVFFNVSGGPLGSEEIISAAGPVFGLSAMLLFVLVYLTAVICSEEGIYLNQIIGSLR